MINIMFTIQSLHRKYLLCIFVCVFVSLLSFYWWKFYSKPSIQKSSTKEDIPAKLSFKEHTKELGKVWDAKGYDVMYAQFLDYADKTKQTEADSHLVEHWIGEQLYMRENTRGITRCSNFFQNGCFHGFMIIALVDKGEQALREFEEICSKDAQMQMACMHGVGHAFLSLEGYEVGDVVNALYKCDQIKHPIGRMSCYNGLFMEFHTPSLHANRPPVKFDFLDPYYPCFRLDEKYRGDCFIRLSGWWVIVLKNDYKKMSALCSGLENDRYRDKCFEGFGIFITVDMDYDVSKIKKACNSLFDKGTKDTCLYGAVREFVYFHPSEQKEKLCSLLSLKNGNECQKILDSFWDYK